MKAGWRAQTGWSSRFRPGDFDLLRRRYPVTWIVAPGAGPDFADCRYHNKDVSVCRIAGP